MGALDGIVVLDHTTALAGPYCAQLLGDLGAEVIKLERPGSGDQSRDWGPRIGANESAYFMGTNRNKRSLTLNLAAPAGRDILHKLVARADVLLHNVPRENSRQKLGLDEATCRGLNERLIWASISGFGNSGPLAENPGYDVIAQGMSGTMWLTGEADGGPIRFPTAIADITTGMYTALAIVAALFARERSGVGQAIDNALLDSQVTWLAYMASNYLIGGEPFVKQGNAHPSIVPYQPFPTADGWIIIGAGAERHWQRLTELIEMPTLAEDDRFRTNPDRLQQRQLLVGILTPEIQKKSTATWLELLREAGIPCGVINRPEEALNDEQILARGMIVELEHPAVGSYKSLGNPINLDGTPITYRRPAPLLGEHNQEILTELGFTPDEIAKLMNDGTL
ncbi:MAG: CoA transferase [Ardenticatenales bacterium]|nr:CoA transferase [Ardenticatenales bacterium]